MKKRTYKQELFILFSCFIVSRVVSKLIGITFGFNALYEYWQYLDVTSLSRNLLQSLWYQHSQPPLFNLLLGIILKCSGNHAPLVMESFLMAITFVNGLLLLRILRNILHNGNLPIIFSLIYLISPATILFENELFYTTFISLLLLLSVYFMIQFTQKRSWLNAIGIFVSLALVCLTKSMYHLFWLLLISGALLYLSLWKSGLNKLLLGVLLSISLVAGWYAKNYLLFGNFSASSWSGINIARIVFQNIEVTDSNNIASVHPFLPISYYKKYISSNYKEKFAGINDRILLMETKNDSFINMNHVGYLQVSRKYMDADRNQVLTHPAGYFKNVFTSFIIFFTPASSYFKLVDNLKRLGYYDTVYSFNPSYFFKADEDKKQWLVIAAIPKFIIYFLVFFIIIRNGLREVYRPVFNIFIITTIIFTIVASSMFEYGENMRFRYEIEPLFLILAAQAVASIMRRKNKETAVPADYEQNEID